MLRRLAPRKRAEANESLSVVFGRLYLQHAQSVYRYVYYQISDPAVSEDITEEAFVAALENSEQYDGDDPVLMLVFHAADAQVANWLKRRPRGQAGCRDSEADYAELARALRLLPRDVGRVMALRLVAGLDSGRVAQIVDRPEPQVRELVVKGMGLLAEILRQSSHPLGRRLSVGNEPGQPVGQLHIRAVAG